MARIALASFASWPLVWLCAATIAAQAPAAAKPPPAPEALVAALPALGDATELAVFSGMRPGGFPRVLLATLVRAPAHTLAALLGEPAAYQRAIPAFRRAKILERRGSTSLVEWELEIPLWNLAGRLRLEARADGADLVLLEGDLSPGRFSIFCRPVAGGAASAMIVDARANLRDANWLTRRLAARSPLAEPAMVAAAAHVLLRALKIEAERAGAAPDPRRRPAAATSPPDLATLDARALHGVLTDLGSPQVSATVRSRPDGRLQRIEVALSVRLAPEAASRHIADPVSWRLLPGWREVKVKPSGMPSAAPGLWAVDSRFPFVDFDATWRIRSVSPFRADVVAGDTRGAVLGWDVWPSMRAGEAQAVLSLHPRIDKTGYLPRKFIEAEPLLEHGLALGLAYVNAVSLFRAYGAQ